MEIEDQIKQYLAQNLLFSEDGFHYADTASLLEEGIIDSMGVMELVMYIGTNFEIQVDPADVTPENFDSVRKISDYVRRKKGLSA